MTELRDKLIQDILSSGPMPVDEFLRQAISFYYANNPGIGKDGDFITAPEISPMFGKTIAAWILNYWVRCGKQKFRLIEIGPGNGTLMKDILNTVMRIEGVKDALQEVCLVENSEYLQAVQKQKLRDYKVTVLSDLEEIKSSELQTIVIANELFDALPVKQYIKTSSSFYERLVDYQNNELCFITADKEEDTKTTEDYQEGEVYEFCPLYKPMAKKISSLIRSNNGAGLILDYGYYYSPKSSTIQAMRNHKHIGLFAEIGLADYTYYVDFKHLAECFAEEGFRCNISTQANFLKHYGIREIAATMLSKGADRETLYKQLDRLTGRDQMGELFKVLEIG